jgi:hypothetical protein
MNPIEFDRLIARARNPRLIPESTTVGRRAGVDLSKLGGDEGAANVRNAFEHHYDDPLVARSRDYARLSYPVSQALGPIVAARGDQQLKDAVDTIAWFSTLISSKLFRAVAGRQDADIVDGEGDGQQDWDGSAKVALHKRKGPTIFIVGPRGIMPAATYSPIQFPIQYHRRYQA